MTIEHPPFTDDFPGFPFVEFGEKFQHQAVFMLSPQLQSQWHRDLGQVLDLAQALDLTPETPETSVEFRGSML